MSSPVSSTTQPRNSGKRSDSDTGASQDSPHKGKPGAEDESTDSDADPTTGGKDARKRGGSKESPSAPAKQ